LTLETSWLSWGEAKLSIEVAFSLEDKLQGLSGRPFLPEDQGLLFLFDPPERAGVGMQGVGFPLSVAFLSDAFKILAFHDLMPDDPEVLVAPQPIRAFLEVNQGWFERKGLQVGDHLAFTEQARWIRPPRRMGFV